MRQDPAASGQPLEQSVEDKVRLQVERARQGDAQALGQIYQSYHGRVVRFCLSFARVGRADAQDITQEVFLRAFRGIGRLRDADRFEGWLLTIARRRCLTFLRRAAKQRQDQAQFMLEEKTKEQDSAQAARERKWTQEIVGEEIARMPDSRQKEAGRLFYLEGRDTGEISACMQVPVSTVTTWLSRFRGRIRRRLLQRVLVLRGHESGASP